MKKSILFLIIFSFLLCPVVMAEEISLTLDEATAIALRENRDILLKAEDVKKAKARLSEAHAGLFPTLNVTGSITDTREYYSKDLIQTTGQATLKQYLYKGGKTINTIEQNKYKLEVSHNLLEKTELETVLEIKKAFYTLLLSNEFYELNKGIVENIQSHLNSVTERYKSGQASESDIFTIESSLSSAEEALETSLNQMESGQVLLNKLLYLGEDARVKPNARFSYEPIELAYDEAFLVTMENRSEIRQYEAQIQADKKTIEIAKADSRPNIYASWDYYSRSHASATTSKNWNDNNVIGLTFSWPIFDGWATKAKVEQAIVDLKETQLLKEKTIKDIALELKNAYLDLKNAISKLRAVESDIKVYSDNLLSINKRHKQGIASFIDLRDASLKYDISIFNKKQAIYDYIVAKSSFDKATGGL